MMVNLFFIFEQAFTFYQLITLVTLMRNPLKTAMGSWAPSLHIITILLLLLLTRSKRRAANISDIDITSESAQARI